MIASGPALRVSDASRADARGPGPAAGSGSHAAIDSRLVFARIDHVGVAVEDIDAALELYSGQLGVELVHRESIADQGVEAALLDVGENHVELVAPLGPETTVGRFIAERGPGLHHVAYQVGDIDAELGRLRDAGLRLIDESPRTGIRGSRVAFLHPRSTGGVLTEIVEPAKVHA